MTNGNIEFETNFELIFMFTGAVGGALSQASGVA
jgi:hypothetical protein